MHKKTQKKYHELSYEVLPDTYNEYDCRVKFDGFVSDYIFNIPALKASTIKNGIYPIILCSCGIIGCGGAYILTHMDGKDIVWEKFWDGMSCGESDEECEYPEFDLIFPYDEVSEHLVIVPPLRFRYSEYKKLVDDVEVESIKRYKNIDWIQETMERYLSGDAFIV